MIKYSFLVLFTLFSFNLLNAQISSNTKMEVEVKLTNPSKEINDGVAKVRVRGGVAPYQYKWSNVNTSLKSDESVGLIEGMKHSVEVTDANGAIIKKKFKIKAKS